ncbi:hypothetical protein F5Y16DRAFT_172336 [Xylariaceae sp. FL0255]|nr:hypothetical protein F5Y16DRAFT_172336 [Xylariaceae sp. FL0255]
MPPHAGLNHINEYDWRHSNVEFIGTELDHKVVKYNSAATEPAWQHVGNTPGLHIWRIEDFAVVALPRDSYGDFHEGDSYIILHSYQPSADAPLAHDIFFWLGRTTSQDEAGTAAYKTVELDEYLHGVAVQHRELRSQPSDDFLALFPRIRILSGGVRSGFTHVEPAEKDNQTLTLLKIFKHPSAARAGSIMVQEVEPTWRSLDENDVFIPMQGSDSIRVWQGKSCSPIEKAKAAQVVHDMTLAKHVDVEVISQLESRSRTVVDLLSGEGDTTGPFHAPRPFPSHSVHRPRTLWRLSDASGELEFTKAKEGDEISRSALDSNHVFLLDTGRRIWVWQGSDASRTEGAMWIKVAELYIRKAADKSESDTEAHLLPITKVVEGSESPAFTKALTQAVVG